jgi:RepB DNA-primase from phage plasmid
MRPQRDLNPSRITKNLGFFNSNVPQSGSFWSSLDTGVQTDFRGAARPYLRAAATTSARCRPAGSKRSTSEDLPGHQLVTVPRLRDRRNASKLGCPFDCKAQLARDGFRARGGGRDFAQQFPGLVESRESPFRSVSEHPRRAPAGHAVWRGSRELRLAAFWAISGFTNQKKERRLENGFQPFVRLHSSEGKVYSAAKEFLREVEARKCPLLSQRELRKAARLRRTDAVVRSLASFHTDPRYGNDLHRADMAWALHAATLGLSREQIEHEILNARDLSKKGPPLRRWAYAMRTASKAIALSAQ